jgi:NADH-quinone oxidoreductase subunit H
MDWMSTLLIPLLKIVAIIFGFAMLLGTLLTLAERKQSAIMQRRVGPNRANLGPFRLGGLIHIAADGIKTLFKEDFTPDGAHKKLHAVAPALGLMPAMIIFAIIPFMDYWCHGQAAVLGAMDYCFPEGDQLQAGSSWLVERLNKPLFNGRLGHYFQIVDLNSGLLYMFAITGVSVYGTALAGWASNSKFSLMGGLRASAQMISYEVSMALSIAGLLLIYGTLDLNEMVRQQGQLLFGFLPMWGIVVQPLAFVMFLTASIAESKRAPFDMPEAESELVAGYFTEYSSMKFAIFSLGEFVAIGFIGTIMTVLFLGGWQVPWLYADGFHVSEASMLPAAAQVTGAQVQAYLGGAQGLGPDLALPYWAVVALRIGAFLLKTLAVVFLQLQIRWTLPRFRYDQIMHLGWKILLPASLINLAVTALLAQLLL